MYEPVYQSMLRHLHELQSKCDEGKSQRNISHTPTLSPIWLRHIEAETQDFWGCPVVSGIETLAVNLESCGLEELGRHGLGSGEF